MSKTEFENNYRLIDCGGGRRLEDFAGVITDRPAPMALWPKKLSTDIWQKATLRYDRDNKTWQGSTPSDWQLFIDNSVFCLETSSQSQVGVFPEQQENWRWLKEIISTAVNTDNEIRVLNTFAHTGGSTLAAALAGANVCHLDAAKSAVNRARDNAGASGIAGDRIRWIVDDAVKFMQREIKRGIFYDGIILDPPAFGRLGKNIWKLEKNLPELLDMTAALLSDKPLFVLLSCHPEGWNKNDLRDAVEKMLIPKLRNTKPGSADYFSLQINSSEGNSLPLGMCARLVF